MSAPDAVALALSCASLAVSVAGLRQAMRAWRHPHDVNDALDMLRNEERALDARVDEMRGAGDGR